MDKPALTPRQEQARQIYNEKFSIFPAFRVSPALLLTLRILMYVVGYSFILLISVNPQRWRVDYVLPFLVALLILLTLSIVWRHKSAIAAVRRAGLWDETRESIVRTATTFEDETPMFHDGQNRWKDAALALFLVVLGFLTGGVVFFLAIHLVEKILGVLCFICFLGCALFIATTARYPNVRLDARGVFAFYRNFWPRLVRWRQIESAEFRRWNNPYDGADIYTVTLKNAVGQTLLTLNAATFEDAPPGFEAQFIAELKRRLHGDETASNSRVD